MSKKTASTAAPADDLLGTPAPATATKVVKKPAKTVAAPAAAAAPADDLLGTPAPAAETAAKKVAAPKEPKVRDAISFEEGEREAYEKAIKRIAKTPIVTRELNKKLVWGANTGMPGRKLRDVLYAMQRKGAITLTPGANRAAGMTVALPTPEQAEAFKAKKAEAFKAKEAEAFKAKEAEAFKAEEAEPAKRAKKADAPAA